jgi:hypothetical protein
VNPTEMPDTPRIDGKGRLRRMVDYGVIGTLALILTLFFWPFGGGGSEGTLAPEQPVVAVMATPGATPTPADTPTPEPEVTPVETPESYCRPAEVRQAFASFVDAFNAGDFDTLRRMLPEQSHPGEPVSGITGLEQRRLYGFAHHPGDEMRLPGAVLDFLQERHEAGERWQLERFQLDPLLGHPQHENPELDVVQASIHRTSDDRPADLLQGLALVNCVRDLIVLWSFDVSTVAGPVPVEQFLDVAGSYYPGEGRSIRMIVSVDGREDGGALTEWEIWREEGSDAYGHFVERITVYATGGERVVTYVFDGMHWYLEQRGWQAAGAHLGPPLPTEIMLVRSEPGRTANLIRAHLDDIPTTGAITLSQELPLDATDVFIPGSGIDSPIVERSFEVLIADGKVVLSRYRIVDQSGNKTLSPEVRFMVARRSQGIDMRLFVMPRDPASNDFQFAPPDPRPDALQVLSQEREPDGSRETYGPYWRGVSLRLHVLPSRGWLDPRAPAERWGPGASPHAVEYSSGWMIWLEAGETGIPAGAIWDDGRYRFELVLSPERLPPDLHWTEAILIDLVETLSGSPPDAER